MRRRRGGWLLTTILPCLVLAQSGYDAQPIGRPNDASSFPASKPVPRGYQPPPLPLLFEAPRSRYNAANQQMEVGQHRGYPSFRSSYAAFQGPLIVPHANARYLGSQISANQQYENQTAVPVAPPSQAPLSAPISYVEEWKQQQGIPALLPLRHPSHPTRLIYTPEHRSHCPGQLGTSHPHTQVTAHRSRGPPSIQPQQEVQPAVLRSGENPPDVLNNIIVHIYLNAKGKQSHTVSTSGPIKGVFGIGTSHGGPGTHTNPIVITKDFDRDTLEFIEEDKARQLVDDGPANIVEVKAMVSTPDRKIENTLNKAVNNELNRAIPMVMNRMQGPMTNMDNELRKELEQALVDELAKNLGETIDEIGSTPSEEDLGKLIEEGFNEITNEFMPTTTAAPTDASSMTTSSTTTTTTTTTTTAKKTIVSTTATTTTRRRMTTRSSSATTLPTTTTRGTTTTAVDEMMKESPFDQPEFRPEPTTGRTPPPRTFRITTTTTSPIITSTVPWWMTTRPTPVRTETPTILRTRPTTTSSTTTTTRPTTITTREATTSSSPTEGFTASTYTEVRTRPPTTIPPTTTTTTETPRTTPRTTSRTTTEFPTTTRVFITTSTIPDRWKTTDVAFSKPKAQEKIPVEFSSDQRPNTSEKPESPALPTAEPARVTGETLVHRESQNTRQGEVSTRWPGEVEPAMKSREDVEEEEPKFVTTRPIHIISIEESAETTTKTTRRGTTMGIRVTRPPTTTEAPHTSIFDESAFGTVTATIAVNTETPTVVQSTVTTTPSSSHAPFTTSSAVTESSTTASVTAEFRPRAQNRAPTEEITSESGTTSTITPTFATLPEESEEITMEPGKGVVMKERPTNFGDQNMMKEEIEEEMLEEGVTEPTTVKTITITATPTSATEKEVGAQSPGFAPPERTQTATEQSPGAFLAEISPKEALPTSATEGAAIPPTEPTSPSLKALPTSATEGAAIPPAEPTSPSLLTKPPATDIPMTTTATTSISSTVDILSTSTETAPFEVPPGMFEPAPPTVAHREPATTGSIAEETTTPFHSTTEEAQPIPDAFAVGKGPCPTPNDETDARRSDVLFLLDSSNSYNEQKFMHAIQLILDTVTHFRNIGPNGTQVSLVQYNSEPYLEFSLRKHNCKKWLIEDIADTDYMQGGNMLGKAVEKVARFAFTKNRGDRPDAENVLVVLTDGQSDDKIQEPVEIAKKNNLTVFVIATLEANSQYIMELAGSMDNVFRFHTDPHKSLPLKLAERITSLASGSTTVPTPEQTTILPSTTSIRILGTHEMFTIALPNEEDEEVWQGTNDVGVHTTVPFAPTASTTPWIGGEPQGMVQLECTHLGFKVNLNIPGGYDGVALVKGQEDKEECRKDIHTPRGLSNSTIEFFVASKTCGVTRAKSVEPAGQNYSLILHLVHHGSLVTGGDKAFLLQCFIGKHTEDTELATNLTVMKGELMIAETISLSSVPPTCAYSIRRDSPDGPVVKNAFVGQTVYHRWDCDGGEEANGVYGMQIHGCYASDDVDMKFPIVDNRGCSSDQALISDPKYYDDRLTAYAESKAFAFQQAESLQFMCKLSLCTRDGDGCEGVTPPACSGNTRDLLVTRRIRHQNTALEGALSSALTTKVEMAPEQDKHPLRDRVVEVFSSKGSIILLAALIVIAIIGTVLLSRYARYTTDASTTYSDPETIVSSPTSPIPPSGTLAPESQPAASNDYSNEEESNRRLAQFMKDFDRSKYV